MENCQIPIIVTRKQKQIPQLVSKLIGDSANKRLRQKTTEKYNNEDPYKPQHKTIETENNSCKGRTRRISSSAAARRFPKDFFKDENVIVPMRKTKYKNTENLFLLQKKQEQLCPLQEKTKINENQKVDTPTFKRKQQKEPFHTVNLKKIKIQQYLTGRKNYLPLQDNHFLDYKSNIQFTANKKIKPFQSEVDPQPEKKMLQQKISNFNVTLGKQNIFNFALKESKNQEKCFLRSDRNIKKEEEKENNCYRTKKTFSNPKMAKIIKGQIKNDGGFRIRKYVPN